MKEIIAIIRMKKMNDTKQALIEAGISSFTALGRILGRGKGQVHFDILEGAENGYPEAIEQLGGPPRLVAKRLIAIVVPDEMKQTAIDTIIKTNQTGKPGDGKIFVTDITDSIRVRTGEIGDAALV
ncbi:P-II family nitrogen regulator [Prosthecochloris sp. SCSIO W1101]|uniref:P-II family nitrogen regulator n=1 Tax=Prosthecochloris sp. SCSIO W1101 TaxID=2992242 RepID=UPI00223E4493|nr:P-II family nitrogen regulator [Prosthecochloris sp. SCSIO W1101]UZJ42731.1 P-II family nitrogen regulator [Prosthecochloris sp. SCSIO W1101]